MLGIAISAAVVSLVALAIGLAGSGLTVQLAIIVALATASVAVASTIATWLMAHEAPRRLGRHYR
ncbi:hypothetical protein LZC95_11645 [Pendulispora brunnea]|uniref:Uncharacterized protein n=1 Tax=Pendulispora brunnea TaxID=2905690 RepID=A0ABZ2KFK7_9BACT